MRSIRSYLLLRLLGGAALVLAGAGIAVYLVVARSLANQFDQNLSDRVQGFASILFQVEDEVEFEFSEELMPEYAIGERPDYFELWFQDGRILERSPSLQGTDLTFSGAPSLAPSHWTAPLPDGREGRYVARLVEVHHVYPEEGPDRPDAATTLIVVARGREELLAAELKVMIRCGLASLVLIGLIALLSWTAVERGLEPTNRLAATLDAIQVDRVPERLDVGELPSELRPMAQKTDALLGRLSAALERERRTTADIAHELRTPISELITVSEVALRDGRDTQGAQRALGTIRDVAWRMGRSVATLLKLARLEMGAETFEREGVDLGVIVRELRRSLSAVERERGLLVENQVGPGVLVEGDRDVLGIVVSNLLSNAMFYAPARSLVTCRLESSPTGWRFVVENDAADLRPADLLVMTEPFWRKDKARANRNRSGLGLSISRRLAEKTGMSLEFELEEGSFRAILGSTGACDDPAQPEGDGAFTPQASEPGRVA